MTDTLKINVNWVTDDNPDLDWLGEYINDAPGDVAYVDRKHNILVIPESVTKEFSSEEEYKNYCEYIDSLDLYFDDYEDEGKYFVEHKQVIDLPFSTGYGSYHDLRFVRFMNYENPSPEDYQYIFQDLKELEDYNKGSWYMRGCTVTASIKEVELAHDSLWGLPSTMDESENQVIVDGLTYGVILAAKEKLTILQGVDLSNE